MRVEGEVRGGDGRCGVGSAQRGTECLGDEPVDAAHVEQPQPLTAEGCVSMQPYGVRPDHAIRVGFEQQFAANAEELCSPDARTYMLLRRRNDVERTCKDITMMSEGHRHESRDGKNALSLRWLKFGSP